MILFVYLAVIIWPDWLVNDFGNFPFTIKRARLEYSSFGELWLKCTGDICIFSSQGANTLYFALFLLQLWNEIFNFLFLAPLMIKLPWTVLVHVLLLFCCVYKLL